MRLTPFSLPYGSNLRESLAFIISCHFHIFIQETSGSMALNPSMVREHHLHCPLLVGPFGDSNTHQCLHSPSMLNLKCSVTAFTVGFSSIGNIVDR